MTAGRTKTHPLLEADRKREVFGFTPATLSIKQPWSLTQARWFHEASTFWSADFLNKVTMPCPSSSSFNLPASRASSSMSLDFVTNCEESARSLAAWGQPTRLEDFWVRLQQLPGPLLLRICPSKFPKVASPAPALGSGIKKSTFATRGLRTEG